MGRIDQCISARFAEWEQRGRGWHLFERPVRPEPAFEEFGGYTIGPQGEADDGRSPGLLASVFDRLRSKLAPTTPPPTEDYSAPEPLETDSPLTFEFAPSIPAKLDVDKNTLAAFFDSLAVCSEPVCFEIFATGDSVSLRFASSDTDTERLRRQLKTFFPNLIFTETQNAVSNVWVENEGEAFIVDFGLAHEFMLPVETEHRTDACLDLIGALASLQSDELALFQVIFQPAQHTWGASIWRSITDRDGRNLFINRPELISGTKQKVSAPLVGVTVRAAAKAADFDRAAVILRNIAFSLRAFTKTDGNRLIALHNDDYAFALHEEDLLARVSRRSGMLLNRNELTALVHFPSDEIQISKLRRQKSSAKLAPDCALNAEGILVGLNEFAGRTCEVRLTPEQRVRHMHVIGATGTGKSTLLFNLIKQDIETGQGVAVLDPHGDLIDRILGAIPPDRTADVVLLDPSDATSVIGFNILSAHSDFEKNLLASDLVSVFRRLCSSWGDQMGSVLNNAILAFLESSKGGTLVDVRRFLLDAEFRNEFLTTVQDPEAVYYWRKAFPQLGGNKSVGPVLTRLDTFLGPKPLRYMVSQRENRLDFTDILNTGKIFLAKLPQGQIGRENAFLLGSLLLAKLHQSAMGRQRLALNERRDFWCYIDEFPNFITPSIAEILSGARKYRMGLILAHQDLQQLQRDPDVASAVMSSSSIRIIFRVGDADAHVLEKGLASFKAKDIQSLGIGEAVCRVERSDFDFNLTVPLPASIDSSEAAAVRHQVEEASRERYGTPRAKIESSLRDIPVAKDITGAHVSPAKKASSSHPKAEEKARIIPAEPPNDAPVPAPVVVTPNASEWQPDETVLPKALDMQPASEGLGGGQHQATQKRIKEAAESLGFLAIIEKAIPEGSIDIWLERPGTAIACEISVTTTIDHEFQNVQKCIGAKTTHIAVISSKRRVEQIREAVNSGFGLEQRSLVGYYTADEFISWLKTVPKPVPPTPPNEPTITTRRGRTIHRKFPKLTDGERKQKEAEWIETCADITRKIIT